MLKLKGWFLFHGSLLEVLIGNASTYAILIQGDSSSNWKVVCFDHQIAGQDGVPSLTYSMSRVNSDSQSWEEVSSSKWTHIEFHPPFSLIHGEW